jgi:hypothetical protein
MTCSQSDFLAASKIFLFAEEMSFAKLVTCRCFGMMKTVTNDFVTKEEIVPEPKKTEEIKETVRRAKVQFGATIPTSDIQIGPAYLIPTDSGDQQWQQHFFAEIAD